MTGEHLSPWRRDRNFLGYEENDWVREILERPGHYIILSCKKNGAWQWISTYPTFDTAEEAMKDADIRLQKEFDYVLLTQEQWDKLSVLI